MRSGGLTEGQGITSRGPVDVGFVSGEMGVDSAGVGY
jgi:hypothetical protein